MCAWMPLPLFPLPSRRRRRRSSSSTMYERERARERSSFYSCKIFDDHAWRGRLQRQFVSTHPTRKGEKDETPNDTKKERKGKGDEKASPSCSNGKERNKKTRTYRCGVDDVLRFGSIVILFDRHTHHTRCMSLGVLREHCAPRALCMALRPPFRPPNPPNDLLTRPIHPIDRSVAPDRALNRSHTRSNRTQGPVNVLRSSVNAIRAADGEPPPAAATSSPPRAPIHMAGRDASSCDPRSRTSGPSVRSPSQPPRLASSVLGRVGRTDGCCGGVHPSTG